MKNFLVILILLVAVVTCSSIRTIVVDQNRSEYQSVIDSIKNSGTEVSQLRPWCFTVDDGRKDSLLIGTLYKNGESIGSIQIRRIDSMYNIKVIDVLKGKDSK